VRVFEFKVVDSCDQVESQSKAFPNISRLIPLQRLNSSDFRFCAVSYLMCQLWHMNACAEADFMKLDSEKKPTILGIVGSQY